MKMVGAVKKYFGLLPGQTLGDFAKEYRELTEEDINELRPLLAEELGEDIDG